MVNTKPVLQRFWKDTLTVTEWAKVTKPNKSTGFEEAVVLENEPCKLSYFTLQSVNQGDDAAKLAQVTKLFLDCDVPIKAGSKLTVQHKGQTLAFGQSGEPGVFSSHQEIVLVPWTGWA